MCRSLSLRIDSNRNQEIVSKWKKVNPKKVHEVLNFSQLIGEKCAEKKIERVVDIGAGLVREGNPYFLFFICKLHELI